MRTSPFLLLAPVALAVGCSENGSEIKSKSRFQIVASDDAERAFVLDTVTGCVEAVERGDDGKLIKRPLTYPKNTIDDACYVMPIPGTESWRIKQKLNQ